MIIPLGNRLPGSQGRQRSAVLGIHSKNIQKTLSSDFIFQRNAHHPPGSPVEKLDISPSVIQLQRIRHTIHDFSQ